MKKIVLSVLIVFFSIYAGIAANSCPSVIATSPGLINLTTPSDLDSLALVALYNQCNGVNWTKQANWLTGPMNTWQGVTVESGRVVILNLGDQNTSINLAGPLPVELSNLTLLRTLNLSNNKLTGSLPDTWSALVNVNYLNLSNNQLSGPLPDSWSSLTNLQILELWSNQFIGSLPVSWAALVNMTWLVLGANQLTGTLPESWSALVNLEGLWLQQNKFTGTLPEGWSAFGKMFSLMLESNKLTGSVPLSWQAMTKLQTFYLHNNQISGLPQLSGLSRLISMVVYNNLLDFAALEPNIGMAAGSFSYSPQLPVGQSATILKAPGDQFTFSVTVGGLSNTYQWYKDGVLIPGAVEAQYVIPAVIIADAGEYTCQISNTVVTQLILTSNPITLNVENRTYDINSDSLALVALYKQCNGVNWTKQTNWLTGPLSTWQGVTVENGRVVGLELGFQPSVGLTGQLPTELSELSELRSLSINNNNLTGTLPASWSSLTQLQFFNLGSNQISGSLPASWSGMVNLEVLNLSYNKLTGTLPDSWATLTHLQQISLSDNQISGTLPESWSTLVNLQSIDLHNNQLSGPLPPGWSTLHNLIDFSLLNNRLSGTLPESWSVLVNLRGLVLGLNNLSGSLPAVWSELVNLTQLNLGNNLFTGDLPASWSSMINLNALWLTNDKLSGALPDSWKTMVNMTQLFIGSNNFSGSFPESWKTMRLLTALFLNDNQISSLPILSEFTKLNILSAENNQLDFGSIEPNIGIAKALFVYSPQANIGQTAIMSKNPGDQFSTSVTVGGQNNKYQWYKNGALIPGANGNEFFINVVSLTDAGDYTCQITNTVATQLTLSSNPITLQIGNLLFNTNSDSLALVALYKQCNGVNWTKQTNWLTGPLSTWQGVTVENGRVVGLELGFQPSVGLTGQLPSEISNLTEIRTLNFSNNQLTGNLPESWSGLMNLAQLDLRNNKFIGTLPLSWSALANLNGLSLGSNQLTGTLPEEWKTLTKLTELIASNNQLTGSLPQSWAALLKLEALQLDYNQLTGSLPPSWSTLVNLSQLGLSSNQFTGALPDEWKTLVKLTFLTLSSNQLTDKLPDSWASLVNLIALTLWQNQLSGPLPSSWSALTQLQELDLYDNQFTGFVPDSWATLTSLTQLTISKNQISGLPVLSALTKLKFLDAGNNLLDFGTLEPNVGIPISTFFYSPQAPIALAATIIKNLGDQFSTSVTVGGQHNQYQWFKNGSPIPGATAASFTISSVALADAGDYTCQITNTVATQLTLTSSPITLRIGNQPPVTNTDSLALVALYTQCNGTNWTKKTNWLSGPMNTWQGVTVVNGRVTELELGDPYISVCLTGPLPPELSNLTEITSINLDNNKLSGTLPDSWSALIKLKDLRLGVNQFNGNLPPGWSSLIQLQVLDIGNNQLTGSLPSSWEKLVNLVRLNLSANHLSGNFPETWAALASMQQLWLGNNQLTGSLPANLSGLKKLQELFLGNNLLSGSLPLSWNLLTNLRNLQLNDNQLTGSLPDNWSDLGQLQFLYLGNNQLSGSLPLSWKALVNLNGLLLYNNQFTGSLPENWSALVNLHSLVLNNNQFTGNLPVGWGSMVNLSDFYLNSNKLAGSIPESWSSLTAMQHLQLDNNQLTGNVPASWISLIKLTQLNISNNQLTGMPVLSAWTKMDNLSVQNNLLDFGFIEPNVTAVTGIFNYSPQARVGTVVTLVRNPGEEFRISISVGGQSNKYQWYKDGIAIPGATSAEFLIPSVTTTDGGEYTLEITNTVATKLTLKSNPITLKIGASGPVADAGVNQLVNTGATVTLNSSGSSHDAGKTLTYIWTAPYGITLSSTSDANPTFIAPHVTADINYTFSLVVNDGNTNSLPVEVVITVTNNALTPCEKNPIVDLYLDFTATPTTLDSRHRMVTCAIPYGLDLTYEWDLGDGSIDHGIVIQHNYDISNTIMKYIIKVTVSNSFGCVRSASKVIDAIPFIPNVFSPNGDGINDVFMPNVDLQIFDRNGTIYYKGNSGWDGTYKGRIAEQDTYFYLIEFTDGNQNFTSRKGFITLVK